MTLATPVVFDARRSSGVPAWLRGIGAAADPAGDRPRMFAYIFSHYFNHALGNISYETMQAWVQWHTLVLALSAGECCALHRGGNPLFARPLGALQAAAFSFLDCRDQPAGPWFKPSALACQPFRRHAGRRLDLRRRRARLCACRSLPGGSRSRRPSAQTGLLLVAWGHACIGLYFWLRMKPFFQWAAPVLLSLAVLMPIAGAARCLSGRPRSDRFRPGTGLARAASDLRDAARRPM